MTTRAALLLGWLAFHVLPAWAADPSATERLMAMADCIRDAGDMKGAPREAFMKDCMARKARAVQSATPAPKDEPVLPGIPVKPVAPPAKAVTGLPAQERILACATASKGMQGEARTAYLRQCLAEDQAVPAQVAARGPSPQPCAVQAQAQPAEERQAFLVACMKNLTQPHDEAGAGLGVVAPGVINQATVPHVRDDGAGRRRAACVVAARDKQGAARQAFIEQCLGAQAQAPMAAVAPAPAPGVAQRAATDRLMRSKACADELRAKGVTGAEIMNFMNACMARP